MFEFCLLAASEASVVEASEQVEDALPQAVYRMISVAARDGEDIADVDAVVAAAKLTYPEFTGEIDALLALLASPVVEPALTLTGSTVQGYRPPQFDYFRDWKGRIAVSASTTDGNTDTSAFGMKLKMDRAAEGRVDQFEAYADTAENNGNTSQRRWGFAYQVDANITDFFHGYVRASHDENAFSGFDRRTFLGGGTGRNFVERDDLTIKGQIGPGYRFTREADTDETRGEWVLYSALDVDWLIPGDIVAEQDVRLTASEPSAFLVSSSALSFDVSRGIRTGVSYEFRYETDPPDSNENQDSILKLNVSYGF
ncbi:MAG: DUF481 domain-containing protein [Pseudomonadota bacterium]